MLYLRIDLENLIYNAKYLRSKTSAELCAVVKANAYGHGMDIVKYLDDYADSFAVSCLDEAACVRKLTNKPIYVLSPSPDADIPDTIYCAVSEKDLCHKRICIKINSGMNRLGVLPSDANTLIGNAQSRGVSIDSLYTHFSSVDYAPVQFKRFMSVKGEFKRHACSSCFLQLGKEYHLDMVRCGLALYGYGDDLRPVLSAYTKVYEVLNVKKGDRIGYSVSADRDMRVAVVGAGYADLPHGDHTFFIGGDFCKTVGRICMDMSLVEVGDGVAAGDIAEFIGEHISARQIAERNGDIIYRILTSLGGRSKRIYE